MKDLLTVMKFTMKDMLKRKSFITSTIIILVLIVLGFNIPNIMNGFKGEGGESAGAAGAAGASQDKLLVVDAQNVFEGSLEAIESMDLGYEVETINQEATFEQVAEKIKNEEIKEALIINKQDQNIDIKYVVKDTGMMTNVPERLQTTLNSIYSNLQISKLGLTQDQLQSLTPQFNYTLEQADNQKAKGNVFAMMILSLVLFYAIYFCAYQVSSSITTEKTSKIMETLVTSTSPRTIVLGKTIGIGIVGLLQMVLIVGTALISAKVFLAPGILDSILDMSSITPYLGLVTIVYFLLGYLAYALLYALTGSTVSKPEDIQSANTPVALLAVVGFYLSYFTMMNPSSDLNVFASMFPISSPFCMPFRVMMGLASTTDVLISIAILVVTILVIAKIAIKIYSNAILNYGSRITFKDMLRIYKDKNN